jgi:hypothetical protein
MGESLLDVFCVVSIIVVVVSYSLILWRIWKKFIRAQRAVRDTTELCYICFENASDVVLIQCGHAGVCHSCVRRILGLDRRCPLCRAPVNGVIFSMPHR